MGKSKRRYKEDGDKAQNLGEGTLRETYGSAGSEASVDSRTRRSSMKHE